MISSDGARLGEEAARRLARAGRHAIGPGLTDAECARIEREYGFEFADDHRVFLAAGLPLNRPWPDWRHGDPTDLRKQLGWPAEGVLFDVEHNALWHPSWGQRPAGAGQALSAARQHLTRAPAMIPVYAHRYLPAGRGTHGHPVLSMYQTDIIVYGTDLADYIDREFTDPTAPSTRAGPRRQWCPSGATSSNRGVPKVMPRRPRRCGGERREAAVNAPMARRPQ